jgi:glycine/D-amino acid oxidase-like deaminating enzyme
MAIPSLSTRIDRLPVAVIGAGPIGLVAAAHLIARGETPLVLEAGEAAGASIRQWAHVRLFSPWKYLIDPVAQAMLDAAGWEQPDPEAIPTGGELVERYIEPLAALPGLAPHLRFGRRVTAVSRRGMDKVKSAGRDAAPFEIVTVNGAGRTERFLARAVIDASGTYTTPNPLGASGLPADGEREVAERVHYGIPDVLGRDRGRYAGKRTLVIGSGHSAFNAVLDLADLARREPGTEVVWAVRRADVGLMFGGGSRDALPARGSLGERLRRLVESGEVDFVTGFRVERLARTERGIVVECGERVVGPVDEIVATTGFRPDLGMLRELRTGMDSWLESPLRLAPLIDPNLHSCGTVYPHGFEELQHPEQDFFVVGMKSYGRAPTFLLLTGYEQVRSVVCALTGDMEGARDVRLVLPETGVCSTDLGGSSCCPDDDAAEAAPIAGSCGIAAPCATPAASPALSLAATTPAAACCG